MNTFFNELKTLSVKVSNLSPTMRYAVKMLINAIKDILSGECTEEEVAEIASKLNPERHGMINPNNYISYDKAMKEMPFGYDRNKLNALAKKYGIENKRVNNMPIGFDKREIELLAKKVREEENKKGSV